MEKSIKSESHVTEYTFQTIIAAIISKTITSTTDVNVYISRLAYINIVTASLGQIPALNLPVISVSIIDFVFNFYNYTPSTFPFVATDFTTATDWVVYTLPT
jgi:hypothetical protein